jgi:hypothetical protein
MDAPDLGPCCCCGGCEEVNNVVMLPWKGSVSGTGWGCAQCGLPNDGAVCVVCDACLVANAAPQFAVKGWITQHDREPLVLIKFGSPHSHDLRYHPEILGELHGEPAGEPGRGHGYE